MSTLLLVLQNDQRSVVRDEPARKTSGSIGHCLSVGMAASNGDSSLAGLIPLESTRQSKVAKKFFIVKGKRISKGIA